jgi:hypothetical protein
VTGAPRYVGAVLLAAVCGLGLAPVAAADPSALANGRRADSVIDDLRAKGYNVAINWVSGFDTKPLSQCWVTGINDPGSESPADGAFVTVYVDVRCPNGDDEGGDFGVGIGFG